MTQATRYIPFSTRETEALMSLKEFGRTVVQICGLLESGFCCKRILGESELFGEMRQKSEMKFLNWRRGKDSGHTVGSNLEDTA